MKKLAQTLAALAAVLIGLLVTAQAASADPASAEAEFFAHVNRVRASEGKPPLAHDGQSSDVARAWSAEMARSGQLSHNPNLKSQVQNWRTLGENVGTGSNVEIIARALENSPAHRANMVNASFTHLGVGVVEEADGTVWVTEVFKQARTGAAPVAAPVAPAPRPRTTAAPRPRTAAPKPAPAPKPAAKAAAPVAPPTTVAPAPVAPAPEVAPATPTTAPSPVFRPAKHSTSPALGRLTLNGLAAALLGTVLYMLRGQLALRRTITTAQTFALGRGQTIPGT